MEEDNQRKKPKIYNKDLKEAVEHIKEEVHGEIKGVAENLFKDLSIHFTRRLMLLTSVSLLIALGISYTVLTFSVREYAEKYISQGKQYVAAQNRIEKNQNELKNHYNELADKYSSLNSIILNNANKIYRIGSIFDDLYEQNKKQILSLEDAVKRLDNNIRGFKDSFEQYKKSNEEVINNLKNKLDQIEKESKPILIP